MSIHDEIAAMFAFLSVPTYECIGVGSPFVVRKARGSLATGTRPRRPDVAERWLCASLAERSAIETGLVWRPIASPSRPRKVPKRRDRAAYMREFRRTHAAPVRWARKTESQKERQRASVRRWRERQARAS